MKTSTRYWVKVNRGSLKTAEDAQFLSDLQEKYNANFNTHEKSAMHFDFDDSKSAIGFLRELVEKANYVSCTYGMANG